MHNREWVTSRLLGEIPGIRHGMSTRSGGVSLGPFHSLNLGLHVGDDLACVRHNRRLACKDLGFGLEDWVSGEQVHGAQVRVVTQDDRGRGAFDHGDAIAGLDGLVTDQPGVLLAGYFADCVPLIAVDPNGPRIGIGHAGWRGTIAKVAANLVLEMKSAFASDPGNLRVWIGPSIGPCCFEVSAEVAAMFESAGLGQYVHFSIQGRFTIDLKGVNEHLLAEVGVKPSHIEVSSLCTMCESGRFFSHRASGPLTGRMAALVGIQAAS